MFRLFKNRPSAPHPDFSGLGTDMHSHLLPGIDDGALHLDHSLDLIRGLQKLGYQRIITTPHVMSVYYPNKRETILRLRDEVAEAILSAGIELEFDAAAEYYLDETFADLLAREPLLTLPGHRVLVEMSFRQPYPDLHRILFELQMKGYQPILAHPERYPYYRTLEHYENLKNMGCTFQVNLLSLSGYYGKSVQAAAQKLMEHGLIDYLGTDMHHERHLEHLGMALSHESVIRGLSQDSLKNNLLA